MPPPPHIPRGALGPIAIGSLLIILLLLRTPPARPIFAPPEAVGGVPVAERPRLPGEPTPSPAPLTGSLIRRNALTLQIDPGLYSATDELRLADELERALAAVTARFGSPPSAVISTQVIAEPGCSLSGVAYTAERQVQVFTCAALPRARAVNILAHEFVHQLAHDRYGDAHLSADMILLEGLATWGAGRYWLGDAPDFAAFVRPGLAGGGGLPLATSYVGRPIGDMNTLYYQWASFVDFLIQTYGRERFDQLYVSGSGEPGTADYQGVYTKNLPDLEAEWRAWVLR